MLLMILGVLALVVVAVLIVASMKSDAFRIERSVTIAATPEKAFGLINDFNAWTVWSPWEKMDPNLKRTYGGAPSGKGANYHWVGNKQVGEGRMEITESTPSSRVLIKLDFLQPFEAHNTADFSLHGEGGSTNVTWAMYGPRPFMMKVMSLFMSMDDMVGKDFEKGLAAMKAAAEK